MENNTNIGIKRYNMPKWVVYAVVILIAALLIVGSVFIGVVIGRQNSLDFIKDNELLYEIYNILGEEYYEDIDWESLAFETGNNLVSAINKFNWLELEEEPEQDSYGVGMLTNAYDSRKIAYVSRQNANATGSKVTITEPDKTNMTVGIEKHLGEQARLKRGDTMIAIGDRTIGNNGRFFYVDGMRSDYYQLILSAGFTDFIFREETGDCYLISLVRGKHDRQLASYSNLGQDIGYINFCSLFSEESEKEMYDAADAFVADGNAHTLVLDLRFNGGGAIDTLQKIAPLFMRLDNKSPLMVLEKKNQKITYRAVLNERNGYLGDRKDNFKLVVLVNDSSASASEALVSALNYYNPESVIVGTDTYGKGVAQYGYSVGDGKYILRVVVGKFYSPTKDGWECYHERSVALDYNFSLEEEYSSLAGMAKVKDIRTNVLDEIMVKKGLELAGVIL